MTFAINIIDGRDLINEVHGELLLEKNKVMLYFWIIAHTLANCYQTNNLFKRSAINRGFSSGNNIQIL